MARVFGASLAVMSTEEGAVAGARKALGPPGSDDAPLLPRERAHLAAARRWAAGDMAGAGALLGEISVQDPRGRLALAPGHPGDVFPAAPVSLRDRRPPGVRPMPA